MQGLIYAIEEISHLPNVQPLLFLRTDLFYSHTINLEYDKIRDRMVELKWTKAEILVFIVFRFLSIEQINKNHSDFFNQCIAQNYKKKSGIHKHTSRFVQFFKVLFLQNNKFDLAKNIDAFEMVVRKMKECGIGYGSINHPVDHDPMCGFTGVIGDNCPQCGRLEGENGTNFERIRRITGYLVGTMDKWNDGKRAEEKDRTKHGARN